MRARACNAQLLKSDTSQSRSQIRSIRVSEEVVLSMFCRGRCVLTVLGHYSRTSHRPAVVLQSQILLARTPPHIRGTTRTFITLSTALLQHNASPWNQEGSETLANDTKDGSTDSLRQEPRSKSRWDLDAKVDSIADRLGHDPKELPSLKAALTHFSALGVRHKVKGIASGDFQHNGRLAVLGQQVLGHVVSESLFHSYPDMEGNLILDVVTHLTSTECLAKVANQLGVVYVVRSKSKLSEPSRAYLLARALRAVIGVVYTDVGPKSTRKVVRDFVVSQLEGRDLNELIKLQHPKFMLCSILRGLGQPPPTAKLVQESVRNTLFPSYVVAVYSGDSLLAEGCGTSLKKAEKDAVLAALRDRYPAEVARAPHPSDCEDFREERDVSLVEEGAVVEENEGNA